MKGLIVLFVFGVLLLALSAHGQTADTANAHLPPTLQDSTPTIVNMTSTESLDDDFNIGLGIFALMVVGCMLVCIGAGIVLALAGLAFLFVLLALGIFSTAMVVMLHQKSISKGFKTFLLLSCGISGLIAGVSSFFILGKIMHWPLAFVMASGGIGGLAGGVCIGGMIFFIVRKVAVFLKEKFNIKHG